MCNILWQAKPWKQPIYLKTILIEVVIVNKMVAYYKSFCLFLRGVYFFWVGEGAQEENCTHAHIMDCTHPVQ